MQEALDMSWAEFILRSIAFRDERKHRVILAREIAYQSYCSQFLFSKRKPASKERFWPIEPEGQKSKVSDSQKKAFMAAFHKYKKIKDA